MEVPPKDILIWMAGFLDGEGCFTLYKASISRKTKNRGYNGVIYLGQVVKNSTTEAMKLFPKYFGGYFRIRKNTNPRWKDTYTWRVISQQARMICEMLLPYLKVKKEQAQLIIDYQNHVKDQNWNIGLIGNRRVVPQKSLDYREKIVRRIHELNKVGTETP